MGMLLGRASLKPKPGRDGMTRWNGWFDLASLGSVKMGIKWLSERLEKGKGGIKSNGTAFAWGDRAWMKCILTAASLPGIMKPVRNCGAAAFSLTSSSRHEYCSSLSHRDDRFSHG